MISPMAPDLQGMADKLESELGLDKDTAWQYANAIGDTPERGADGRLVIRDMADGMIIDRISIPGW